MKYIIYLDKDDKYLPIIFPQYLVHSDFDMAFRSLGVYKHLQPIHAGEISVQEVEVYGKSDTLGLVSFSNDKLVIETYDYLHGIQ